MNACPGPLGCGWTNHGRKHFPHAGLKQEDTRWPNPARYLPGTTEQQVHQLKTLTVATGGVRGGPPPTKTEYVRDVGAVIGWDLGENAQVSFAECTSRAYHGRPMSRSNPKLVGWK